MRLVAQDRRAFDDERAVIVPITNRTDVVTHEPDEPGLKTPFALTPIPPSSPAHTLIDRIAIDFGLNVDTEETRAALSVPCWGEVVARESGAGWSTALVGAGRPDHPEQSGLIGRVERRQSSTREQV